MSQNADMGEAVELDLTDAPAEIDRAIRSHLPSDRIDLWEKVASERASGGIDAARSYLHALVQRRVNDTRSELEVIRKEISS